MNVATKFGHFLTQSRISVLSLQRAASSTVTVTNATHPVGSSSLISKSPRLVVATPKAYSLGVQATRSVHSSSSKKAGKSASQGDVSSPIFNVQDEDDFKKRVLESKIPVIIDFHATWCGPCKLLGPRLEALVSGKKGQVTMAKVDIDEQSELAEQYKVRSVPTVLAMKDGKVIDQFIGLADDDKISAIIDKLLHK